MITQKDLKQVLNYNAETGLFTRINRRSVNCASNHTAGSLDRHGYIVISIKSKTYKAHRLAYLYIYGEWPNGQIDHINGVRCDNSFKNLRCVSQSENSKNQKIPNTNTSGVIGVTWCKRDRKWRAQISIMNRQVIIGSFKYKWDAICCRKSAEILHGYHRNHGRLK